MKKIVYTFIAITFSTGIYAQNLVDALRYSDSKINGTARAASMGNAFGALGGDFTSLSINPAGLGVYRSNEFVITSSLGNSNTDGTYSGIKSSDSEYNFQVPNLGYIATFKPQEGTSSLVNINFGVGYNRTNDFSMKQLAVGKNATSSLLDAITEEANNYNGDELTGNARLAYETWLINPDTTGTYTNVIGDEGYGQRQRYSSTHKGNMDEYVFSLAANFNHKLYLGMTLGIQDIYYKETSTLYEYDPEDNLYDFDHYYYDSYLKTTGTGYNFQIGVIYKPINQLRIGLAWHSPTFFDLNDSYQTAMNSVFDNGDNYYWASDLNKYNYKLETPTRTIFSLAYIIGKKGLISMDYEYVDYSSAKLKEGGDDYDFYDENEDIKEAYKSVGNIRIGGEYRLNNSFSLRAGYENYPSAYNSYAFDEEQPNKDANYSSVSAGFGYKQGNFFLDMAYKHTMDKKYEALYDGSDFAKYDITKNNVILSLGFKF